MNEKMRRDMWEGGEGGKGGREEGRRVRKEGREGGDRLIHRPLANVFPSSSLFPWDWPGNEARKGEGREGDVEKKEEEIEEGGAKRGLMVGKKMEGLMEN